MHIAVPYVVRYAGKANKFPNLLAARSLELICMPWHRQLDWSMHSSPLQPRTARYWALFVSHSASWVFTRGAGRMWLCFKSWAQGLALLWRHRSSMELGTWWDVSVDHMLAHKIKLGQNVTIYTYRGLVMQFGAWIIYAFKLQGGFVGPFMVGAILQQTNSFMMPSLIMAGCLIVAGFLVGLMPRLMPLPPSVLVGLWDPKPVLAGSSGWVRE